MPYENENNFVLKNISFVQIRQTCLLKVKIQLNQKKPAHKPRQYQVSSIWKLVCVSEIQHLIFNNSQTWVVAG